MTRVLLNPDTKGYHNPDCRWLAGGAKTNLGKYLEKELADLPLGAKPCSHCAPPRPARTPS